MESGRKGWDMIRLESVSWDGTRRKRDITWVETLSEE